MSHHPPPRRAFLLFPLFLLLLAACFPAMDRKDISSDRLKAHIEFLASDKMAGRLPGFPEIIFAEDYIAAQFQSRGLVPLPGARDYFLSFSVYEYGFDEKAVRLSVRAASRTRRGILKFDFAPLPLSGMGAVVGEVVFAGYGIQDPASGYDDYQGLDVRNKIVLLFRHEPARFTSIDERGRRRYSSRANFSTKAVLAARLGARAVLFVTDPRAFATDDDDFSLETDHSLSPLGPDNPFYTRNGDGKPFPIPAFHISVEWGDDIFKAGGYFAQKLQDALERGIKPAAFPLPSTSALLSCQVLQPPSSVPARDVAALLPGSDPALADEWIVIGAHHDHIGFWGGGEDIIYNGADDNASGVSGVLELARVLSHRSPRLRHGLLFVTFSSEELGLLGSAALFNYGYLVPDRVKYMVNLDMIGRNPGLPLQVIVRRNPTPLLDAVTAFLAERPLASRIVPGDEDGPGSDDIIFGRERVPTYFLFSGLHSDYHKPDDEPDRIAFRDLTERVRLAYDLIEFLDNYDSSATYPPAADASVR